MTIEQFKDHVPAEAIDERRALDALEYHSDLEPEEIYQVLMSLGQRLMDLEEQCSNCGQEKWATDRSTHTCDYHAASEFNS